MRIGNIDDIHKSQDAENLAALIKTDSRETMTKAEKRKNWWYYYKWYVVCGIIILLIACDIISSQLGLFEKSPDFQIAYVGEAQLPQDTISALEAAFASIAGDFNGDGARTTATTSPAASATTTTTAIRTWAARASSPRRATP